MARSLLNHLSDWAIGPIFIAVSVAIALVALWLVRRFLPGWRAAESGEREFALLSKGHEDPQAQGHLALLFSAVQGYSPATEAQRAFYRSVADQLNVVSGERQKRVEAAELSIPGPLLALMVVSALVLLG